MYLTVLALRVLAHWQMVHTECDHAFELVPTCSRCCEEIEPRAVRRVPGPGAAKRMRERETARAA